MRPHRECSPEPKSEPSAFDIWFSQTLKNAFEPVMHEPLPRGILEALPPPN